MWTYQRAMFRSFPSSCVLLSRFSSAELSFIRVQRCSVVESTSRAKLESSCQSKQYFVRILFTLCRSCTAFLVCVTSENFNSLCRIFQLLTRSSVMKSTQSWVCVCVRAHVCVCHLYKRQILEKKMDIFCYSEEDEAVALLTHVIKWYCVLANASSWHAEVLTSCRENRSDKTITWSAVLRLSPVLCKHHETWTSQTDREEGGPDVIQPRSPGFSESISLSFIKPIQLFS